MWHFTFCISLQTDPFKFSYTLKDGTVIISFVLKNVKLMILYEFDTVYQVALRIIPMEGSLFYT